ncbi:MAG: phosphatidate cytidylyltransferase [Rikenellaceae bacterium]|nr:phosphatidate cytidylyltransferase [Rikenellaceae bacterium]
MKGKNLGLRTLSGAVMGIVVVGAVLLGKWATAVILVLIAVGAITELTDLASKRFAGVGDNYLLTLGLAGGWVAGVALNPEPLMLLVALMFVPLIFIAEVFRKSNNTIENSALASMSLLYVALPLALLMLIGTEAGVWKPARVLMVIFTVWVNDIFAYLVGCSIGKHKMCPSISPKKSWEGFVGGVLFAVAFAMAAGYMMEGDIYLWGGLGAVVALAGVVGDLLESKIKRECGVKDSGNLIPGHGGMLDRFDALLLAAPVAYLYMTILGL